ncbi:hypothetical protein ACIPRL_11135 [Streptomyces sp. NPDC090085]|uniref:hypothetical protein n=1 Tax=unclassified Streptomyces TaxID=2593676 RepID=UPI00341D7593
MPARPRTASVTTGGATYDLTREAVEAAASRLLPGQRHPHAPRLTQGSTRGRTC